MTTATKPESTAVATTKPALPHDVQRALDERKLRNMVAAKIAGMSWGGALDLEARRALADWGQQHGVDVTTEIHILGNRIYKNADYYINRAQKYVRAGLIAYSYRYINIDKRLDDLAKRGNADAQKEVDERQMLRIQFNAPEAAHSTALFVVRFPASGESFAAVKWCGGGVRKGDPVGDGNPEATSMTRAARKVLKMAVGYEPEIAIAFGEEDDEAVADVEAVIHRSQSEQKALTEATVAGQRRALRNIENDPQLTDGMNALGTVPVNMEAATDLFADSEPVHVELRNSDDLTDAEIVEREQREELEREELEREEAARRTGRSR